MGVFCSDLTICSPNMSYCLTISYQYRTRCKENHVFSERVTKPPCERFRVFLSWACSTVVNNHSTTKKGPGRSLRSAHWWGPSQFDQETKFPSPPSSYQMWQKALEKWSVIWLCRSRGEPKSTIKEVQSFVGPRASHSAFPMCSQCSRCNRVSICTTSRSVYTLNHENTRSSCCMSSFRCWRTNISARFHSCSWDAGSR